MIDSILSAIRQRQPIRRVNNGGSNVIGRFPSRKTGRVIQYESLLEYRYIIWREWDPAVTEYYDQPVKIPLPDSEGRPRQAGHHVPDFLVIWPDRVALEEVKPQARTQNPKFQARWARAREWAEAQGFAYVVVTEHDLPKDPLLSNLLFLAAFCAPPAGLAQWEGPLVATAVSHAGLSVQELVDHAAEADPRILLPCVWHLVFIHRLTMDLEKAPLRPGAEERTLVYPAQPRG